MLERQNNCRAGQLLAVYETGASCYKSISQFVDDFYYGVFHQTISTSDHNYCVGVLTQAQSQGQGQLIAAAQSLGSTLFNSTEYANLNTSNAQFITDLYWGYLQRAPDTGGYNFWLGVLNGGSTRANVRQAFAVCSEFQQNVAALCPTTSSTSANYKYVLSDLQGSARALMNNNSTSGTSTVIARHDYLPFGEEIWSGTGLRSSSQGYGITDRNRQKYGLTERDDATGLDHTWWRKYESFSGRMTTPDPYGGSMTIADPQSFNRYSYVQNDPVNFVDPSGLDFCLFGVWSIVDSWDGTGPFMPSDTFGTYPGLCNAKSVGSSGGGGGGQESHPGGGGFGGNPLIPKPTSNPIPQKKQSQENKDCIERKRREINAAAEKFKAGVGKRILYSAAWGGVRGAVAGGIAGAAGGGALFGVGAVPGGALGATVGGILGAAGGVITGGLIVEPVRRVLYSAFDYNGALRQAKKYCDAEYPY